MLKLYFSPGACSLSPHIVLHESGLPFDLEKVDLGARRTAGGADYHTINPKGSVPALLLESGEVLTEGPAVVQYIADQAPGKQLAPAAGSLERYRLIEWLNFISTELHKGYEPLFRRDIPEETRQAARDALIRQLGHVDGRLASSSFLVSERFTVADAYLFVILRWCRHGHFDFGRWPAITAYLPSLARRPAVQAALAAEGLPPVQ